MNKRSSKSEKNDIEFYYKHNRFFKLFFTTKKYKDILFHKEAILSLIISVCITHLIIHQISETLIAPDVSSEELKKLWEFLNFILPVILGGLFGLLGFIIGGLAIVTGTVQKEVLDKIRENKKVDHFISVIFNFYFCGVVIGSTLILGILTLLIINYPGEFHFYFFVLMVLLISYLVVFSIMYSVMLLGTCIRIFLLKYYYQDYK